MISKNSLIRQQCRRTRLRMPSRRTRPAGLTIAVGVLPRRELSVGDAEDGGQPLDFALVVKRPRCPCSSRRPSAAHTVEGLCQPISSPSFRLGSTLCADAGYGCSRRQWQAAPSGCCPYRQPGSLAHSRRLGDNAGMARDDSRAPSLLRVALLPALGRGQALGDARMGIRCRPRCYPGRGRGRALGRLLLAAGPGRVGRRGWLRADCVGPWHGSADPGRGGQEHPAEQGSVAERQLLPRSKHCWEMPSPLTARQRSRYARYDVAFSVVGMVLKMRYGLRHPRRLTVLAIADEAPDAVFYVLRVARAVQRRRPRMAAVVSPGRSRSGSPAAGGIG